MCARRRDPEQREVAPVDERDQKEQQEAGAERAQRFPRPQRYAGDAHVEPAVHLDEDVEGEQDQGERDEDPAGHRCTRGDSVIGSGGE